MLIKQIELYRIGDRAFGIRELKNGRIRQPSGLGAGGARGKRGEACRHQSASRSVPPPLVAVLRPRPSHPPPLLPPRRLYS